MLRHCESRISKCLGVVTRLQETNRPRVRRRVLNHHRPGVPGFQETARGISNHNLTIEGFVLRAAMTLMSKGHSHSRVQVGNMAVRRAG
jgi:hypothetical protein